MSDHLDLSAPDPPAARLPHYPTQCRVCPSGVSLSYRIAPLPIPEVTDDAPGQLVDISDDEDEGSMVSVMKFLLALR